MAEKTKSFKERYMEIDNKLTFIVGFRNLYNVAVMFVAAWTMIVADANSNGTTMLVGFVILILGMKWFLTQVRDNIDATDVYDALDGE